MLSRTIYCSFAQAMKIIRSSNFRKLYTHYELEELDEDTTKKVVFENSYSSWYHVAQRYPTLKDLWDKKSRKVFIENPVKLTCFYEKSC